MSELDKNDASHWIWRMFYYNPSDPKLVVTKRFGWGWTFNFAHKTTWLFLLVVIGIAIAVSVLAKR
ncbi:DUF5808 domain-containing protein [Mucilaginibacter gilvus]|uniref:DUF5808 domain-containing protein n=1 Tax=Mucilaginibacter gilvus TaxID=2305909 RepID=A0A444MIH8_9SPHI|nr:DUF5808 domain-containing protein [Mucilaginibacter gilvus]RWY47945.1 hypothetical protein EPL05_20355 [Mucilaginibacter gilvus]